MTNSTSASGKRTASPRKGDPTYSSISVSDSVVSTTLRDPVINKSTAYAEAYVMIVPSPLWPGHNIFRRDPEMSQQHSDGREAPKPCMPTNRPRQPMYLHQPMAVPSSTATRAVTAGGRTVSR